MKKARQKKVFVKLIQIICQAPVLGLFCLVGCTKSLRYDDYAVYSTFEKQEKTNYGVGRFKTSYLVQQIDEHYTGINPGPIGVATFVDLDDLYTTSTFGRVYAEQVMSELAMRGFDVVELRHTDAMQFLAKDGEFALSRDVSMLRRAQELGGVVVGTYAASPERVYVNARLINPKNSLIEAAASVELTRTKEISKLLRSGAKKMALERIPVNQLENRNMIGSGNPADYARQEIWEREELNFENIERAPEPIIPQVDNTTKVNGRRK